MAGIKVSGLDKLQKKLRDDVSLDQVKKAVRVHGSQLQKLMQKNADFKQGYQTGNLKDSIGLELEDEGFTAVSGPGMIEVEKSTEYAPYVEYGTRFMDAQPFVKPSFDEQKEKFKRTIEKMMK